jgi:hypothetical protein
MCYRVECPTCFRPTFAGCGRHAEQVLASVPIGERCSCREAPHGPGVNETKRPFRARWMKPWL